jgi:hypothetical protein
MSRRLVAVVVLLGWIGVMGWLVRREYFRPRAELLSEAALNVTPGATYYALDLGGEQIGFASSLVDTLSDTVRVEDQMLLHIPALGTVQRVEARTRVNLTRGLQLRSFDATLRGADVRFAVQGTVHGDTVLSVEIESADSRQHYDLPLAEPIMLPALLPLNLAFGGELAVGRTYAVRLFDPLQLAQRDVNVTVTAESVFAVPDSAELAGPDAMWVPARWDTLHAWQVRQDMGGFQTEALRLTGGADLIRQTAIASNVALTTETLSRLRIVVGGIDRSAFDLSGGRQTLAGDTLTIAREAAARLKAPWRLPWKGDALDAYLRPEPLVQSDDPRIQAQARQILGRSRSPERFAEALVTWVYDALDKRITVSVPSAVEVLETKRGDCNEHTVLYVALARAAGLPARTAAGLVYVDGRFFYHAWPEVYLDDWVAVDPTFGQFPADAAHLRFTIGGLARQVELIQLIGRLQLRVIETETDE